MPPEAKLSATQHGSLGPQAGSNRYTINAAQRLDQVKDSHPERGEKSVHDAVLKQFPEGVRHQEFIDAAEREPRKWTAVRIAIAIPLLVLSAGALFPFAVIPVSSQAVINARLSEVRTPIEGAVKTISLEAGDVVSVNQPLAEIAATPANMELQFSENQRQSRDLQARAMALDAQLAAASHKVSRYSSDAKTYTEHLREELQSQLRATTAERDAAQHKSSLLSDEVRRDEQAVADHLMPRSLLDQANEKLESSRKDEQRLSDESNALASRLKNVSTGYLLDGNASAPNPIEQQELAVSNEDELRAQRSAIEAQLAQLSHPGSSSLARPEGSVVVKSPVSGPIWSRSASPSQTVASGEDLYRIADCDSIHVDVWLDRRYGPQLSVGDVAVIYLSGIGKELTGRVVSFQGSSRRRLDEEINAIDLQPVHPDQYHVTIELDPRDRQALYIGQSAKVLFPSGKSPASARFYSLLMRF